IHEKEFSFLPDAVIARHRWPALFVKVPEGMLDSPRNHVLVAHEIGHAIAAIHQARVYEQQRLATQAQAAGQPIPAAVSGLLPIVSPDPARLHQIAVARWTATGLPTPNPPAAGTPASPEFALFSGIYLDVMQTVLQVAESWLEE